MDDRARLRFRNHNGQLQDSDQMRMVALVTLLCRLLHETCIAWCLQQRHVLDSKPELWFKALHILLLRPTLILQQSTFSDMLTRLVLLAGLATLSVNGERQAATVCSILL